MVMWSFPLYDFLEMVKNMEIHSIGLHVWKGREKNIPFCKLFIESIFPFDFYPLYV